MLDFCFCESTVIYRYPLQRGVKAKLWRFLLGYPEQAVENKSSYRQFWNLKCDVDVINHDSILEVDLLFDDNRSSRTGSDKALRPALLLRHGTVAILRLLGNGGGGGGGGAAVIEAMP